MAALNPGSSLLDAMNQQSAASRRRDNVAVLADAFEADDHDSATIIMALDVNGDSHIGCCYYTTNDRTLYLLREALWSAGRLQILKTHVQPSVVVLPLHMNDTASDCFESLTTGATDDTKSSSTKFGLPYVLQYRQRKEFLADNAVKHISQLFRADDSLEADLTVPSEGHNDTGQLSQFAAGKLLRLSGLIEMSDRCSLGCASAVLHYLKRHSLMLDSDQDNAQNDLAFQVVSVQTFSFQDIMQIDEDTAVSLQILPRKGEAFHPVQSIEVDGKDHTSRLSLCEMFQRFAKTPQGLVRLRRMFSQPTQDIDSINERLEILTTLLRPDNDQHVRSLTKCLGAIKNVVPLLWNLKRGTDSLKLNLSMRHGVWSSLHQVFAHTFCPKIRDLSDQFVCQAIRVKETVGDMAGSVSLAISQKIMQSFDIIRLQEIGRAISSTIDFPRSTETHKTVVRFTLNEELDELKRKYNGMEDFLTVVSKDVAKSVRLVDGVDLRVLFFPQIGFLICITSASSPGDPSQTNSNPKDQWSLVFSTATQRYYKDSRMQALDEKWGDMYSMICGKEIELIHGLALKILEHREMLTTVSELCGQLDSYLALAQGARSYSLTRPTMVKQNVIKIRNGRHPLLQLCDSNVVSNHTMLTGSEADKGAKPYKHRSSLTSLSQARSEYARESVRLPGQPGESAPGILILTGANRSGKSVYLKQVALIVYMAHVGSFVPASYAEIGLTDRIMTRMVTKESLSRFQSSFSGNLQQVAKMVKHATHRSLLLIDEFAKGTSSSNGAGLFTGLMNHFRDRATERPKVLVATHFSEAFYHQYLEECNPLAFAHLEVKVLGNAVGTNSTEQQIAYLYNLKSGRDSSSYGKICAATNGISPKIIQRAKQLEDIDFEAQNHGAGDDKLRSTEAIDLLSAEAIGRDFLAQQWLST